MGKTYEVLDALRARKNGICQMVVGSLCVVLNIAILIISAVTWSQLRGEQLVGAGIWGGVFYIVSGSLIFVASSRRSLGYVVAALVLNVVSLVMSLPHLAFMSISIMSWEREGLNGWRPRDQPRLFRWEYPTYVSLFSLSTILAYVAFGLTIWAIFLLSEAIYFQRLKESSARTASAPVDSEQPETGEAFTTTSVNHALATASIRFNAVLQIAIALISGGLNIAVIFVVVWGLRSRYEEMNQTNGTAIITAPFYFVLGFFGYTAGKTGSNKRVVTFLCLSIVCGLLAFLEGGGPAVALADRVPGMWLPEVYICPPTIFTTVDPDPWRYHYEDDHHLCRWERPENKEKYYTPLVVMNAIIIFMAFLHLLLSVWGVVIGAQALHKDSTCLRCCGNCFGGDCGDRNDCGDCGAANANCCAQGPVAGGGGASPYQPIQFIVSHQGTTTMANGQQALVVLLPMNGAVNVQSSSAQAGSATVTVGAGEALNQVTT